LPPTVSIISHAVIDQDTQHKCGTTSSILEAHPEINPYQSDELFLTRSGAPHARFQICLLELSGATLLLLDEPTDNLDITSSEALEAALDVFDGTVLTVTHDRWFVQNFDRFFLLDKEGNVKEVQEPVWT
jgi:ABC-type transport system involved in cytochrome bd biosynthesis fused ATPase/permease subunit